MTGTNFTGERSRKAKEEEVSGFSFVNGKGIMWFLDQTGIEKEEIVFKETRVITLGLHIRNEFIRNELNKKKIRCSRWFSGKH